MAPPNKTRMGSNVWKCGSVEMCLATPSNTPPLYRVHKGKVYACFVCGSNRCVNLNHAAANAPCSVIAVLPVAFVAFVVAVLGIADALPPCVEFKARLGLSPD